MEFSDKPTVEIKEITEDLNLDLVIIPKLESRT